MCETNAHYRDVLDIRRSIWTKCFAPPIRARISNRFEPRLEDIEDDDDALVPPKLRVYFHALRLIAAALQYAFSSSMNIEYVDIDSLLAGICVVIYNSSEYDPNRVVFGNSTALEEVITVLVDLFQSNPPITEYNVYRVYQIICQCLSPLIECRGISPVVIDRALLRLAIFIGMPIFSSPDFNPQLRRLVNALYKQIESVRSGANFI